MHIPSELRALRYWPSWLLIGFLWLLAQLPWGVQRRIGTGIGWLLYRLLKQRVNDTRINLGLCFPEKNESERETMVQDVFRNGGIALFETVNAWFLPPDYYRDKTTVEGLEHYQAAVAQGRGLLLLGAHYTTLDLNGTLTSTLIKVDMVYRPQKNPVINHVMTSARSGNQGNIISHRDMRQLLRAFKDKHNVWYAPDQDYGAAHAVFAPFFGVPAATLNTASRFPRINNAPVLFLGVQRDGDAERYHVCFTPILDNFPSDDDLADATRVNAGLEKLIRRAPTQYMWFHRRFKTQQAGLKPPYPPKPKEVRRQKAAEAAAREAQKSA